MDAVLKDWTEIYEKMGIKLTNDKYVFHLLFANDQVKNSQDKYDIEYMIRKSLDSCKK